MASQVLVIKNPLPIVRCAARGMDANVSLVDASPWSEPWDRYAKNAFLMTDCERIVTSNV